MENRLMEIFGGLCILGVIIGISTCAHDIFQTNGNVKEILDILKRWDEEDKDDTTR